MHRNYSKNDIKRILQQDIEFPTCVKNSVKKAITQIDSEYDTEKGQKVIEYKKTYRRTRKIVAAVISILLLGTATTVGATVLQKWNDKAADEFDVNEEQQVELINNSVAKIVEASAECNGVTIKVEQTVADDKYMYILFKVIAPEDMLLTSDTFFENFKLTVDGEDIKASYYAGLPENENGVEEDGTDNVTYWKVWIEQSESNYLQGKDITASFENLGINDNINKTGLTSLVDGGWNLTWNITLADVLEKSEVNVYLSECNATVKSVSISPISIRVEYDYPRNPKVTNVIEENNSTTEKSYYDAPIGISAFKMADGSVVDAWKLGPSSSGYVDETSDTYITSCGLTKIADVNNIVAVIFGSGDSAVEVAVK